MSSGKRQRTHESDKMDIEHIGSLVLAKKGEGGRRGQSAAGGTLRLDIVSCLQPIEAEMFSMMLEAVKLSKSGTVVRVAGGWVRDKLLGLEVRVGDWRCRSLQAAVLMLVQTVIAVVRRTLQYADIRSPLAAVMQK